MLGFPNFPRQGLDLVGHLEAGSLGSKEGSHPPILDTGGKVLDFEAL